MRFKGNVTGIYTEHSYVPAVSVICCKNIDEELNHELWLFVNTLKKKNDIDFHFNHVVFEITHVNDQKYFIGIDDGRLRVGMSVCCLKDSVYTPLETQMKFINV